MGTATRRIATSPTYFKPAPSEIQYGKMRFLITDRPSDMNINNFIEELSKHNARAVVRVCEPTYETTPLVSNGIDVLDWEFLDGNPPPPEVINKWLSLTKDSFKQHPDQCIAVHCVAGLGRAPVLVAVALMEAGMKYEDAVDLIRRHRRGALNQKQLNFLEKYKPSGQLRKLSTESVTTTSNRGFFGVISTPVDKSHEKSLKKRAKKIVEEWLDGELENSLGDATFMNDTRFVKLFIRYNTGMPSGAPVERMFSLGKDIMRAKRSRISDELFNMLMFIKGNEKL